MPSIWIEKRNDFMRGKYATQRINENICPVTVAKAAPCIPQPKPYINKASKKTFSKAPLTLQSMEYIGLPSTRIM